MKRAEKDKIRKWEAKILQQETLVNLFISKALKPEDKIFKHKASNCHMITLFAMAVTLKAKRILDLGTQTGNSALPLLQAAHFTDGTVESVDIKPTKFIHKCPEQFRNRFTFYCSDALKFLRELPTDKIYDLVFIDDDHTCDHVKQEIDLIEPHVTSHSIILMHDAMYYHTYPHYNDLVEDNPKGESAEIARVLHTLSRDEWEYSTIPVCHGLTILRKLPGNPR